MRKALQAEQGNVDLANKIQQLSDKKKALQLELQKQRSLSDTVEKVRASFKGHVSVVAMTCAALFMRDRLIPCL